MALQGVLLGVIILISGQFCSISRAETNVCKTYSSGVINSFSKTLFYLKSTCPFTLTRFTLSGVNCDVTVQRGSTGLMTRVEILVNKVTTVLQEGKVLVEGNSVSLPYDHTYQLLYKYGIYIKLRSKVLPFSVTWRNHSEGVSALWVQLDHDLVSGMTGMCGLKNLGSSLGQFISTNVISDGKCVTEDFRKTPQKSVICEVLSYATGCPGGNRATDTYLEYCHRSMYKNINQDAKCAFFEEVAHWCGNQSALWSVWRQKTSCKPPTCPGDLKFQELGPAFPATCTNPQPPSESLISTCLPPSGTVLNDRAEGYHCISVKDCPCVHGGKMYPPGAERNSKCQSCVCIQGKWTCSDNSCPSPCNIEGQFVTTFDGKQYSIPGKCTYVAARGLSWKVAIKFSDTDASIAEMYLNVYKEKYTFSSNSVKLGPDEITDLSQTDYTTVFWQSSMFVQVHTSFGMKMKVQVSPEVQLYLNLPPTEKTTGLCGTYNNDTEDDFTTSSGIVENAVLPFAQSWTVGACSPPDSSVCINTENEIYAEEKCSQLRNTSSVFARCHDYVPVSTFFDACVQRTCQCTSGLKNCLCVALSNYAKACASQGIDVGNWRAETDCKIICNGNLRFSYNTQACNQTCRSLTGHDPTCEVEVDPVEGCGCMPGTHLKTPQECSPSALCMCHYQGGTTPPGPVIIDGRQCMCENGNLNCSAVCDCPRGKVCVHCTQATVSTAQKTCESLSKPFSVEENCVSGCYCPEGFFEDHNGTCVTRENCTCEFSGSVYASGQTVDTNCKKCTCKGGQWYCVGEPCKGVCEVFGDGQYKTFDSKWFRFDGNCQYTLVEDATEDGHRQFAVRVESVPCCDEALTCSRAISVDLKNEVTLTLRDMNVTQTLKAGWQLHPLYSVHTLGLHIIISVPDLGLTVVWDKHTRVKIILEASWKGKVWGLCGNFDGKMMNDLLTSSSSVVFSPLEFGNSWKTAAPPCSDVTQEVFPCERHSYCEAWAQRRCMILHSDTFSDCHLKVDPAPFYHACVLESCSCEFEGRFLGFCTAVAAYAEACTTQNVCINWRTPDLCPVYCDYYNEESEYGWHYEPCGQIETCGKKHSFTERLEGCYPRCPAEMPYFDENTRKCSSLDNCTCYFNNTIVRPGDKVSQCCTCAEGQIICKNCSPRMIHPATTTTAATTLIPSTNQETKPTITWTTMTIKTTTETSSTTKGTKTTTTPTTATLKIPVTTTATTKIPSTTKETAAATTPQTMVTTAATTKIPSTPKETKTTTPLRTSPETSVTTTATTTISRTSERIETTTLLTTTTPQTTVITTATSKMPGTTKTTETTTPLTTASPETPVTTTTTTKISGTTEGTETTTLLTTPTLQITVTTTAATEIPDTTEETETTTPLTTTTPETLVTTTATTEIPGTTGGTETTTPLTTTTPETPVTITEITEIPGTTEETEMSTPPTRTIPETPVTTTATTEIPGTTEETESITTPERSVHTTATTKVPGTTEGMETTTPLTTTETPVTTTATTEIPGTTEETEIITPSTTNIPETQVVTRATTKIPGTIEETETTTPKTTTTAETPVTTTTTNRIPETTIETETTAPLTTTTPQTTVTTTATTEVLGTTEETETTTPQTIITTETPVTTTTTNKMPETTIETETTAPLTTTSPQTTVTTTSTTEKTSTVEETESTTPKTTTTAETSVTTTTSTEIPGTTEETETTSPQTTTTTETQVTTTATTKIPDTTEETETTTPKTTTTPQTTVTTTTTTEIPGTTEETETTAPLTITIPETIVTTTSTTEKTSTADETETTTLKTTTTPQTTVTTTTTEIPGTSEETETTALLTTTTPETIVTTTSTTEKTSTAEVFETTSPQTTTTPQITVTTTTYTEIPGTTEEIETTSPQTTTTPETSVTTTATTKIPDTTEETETTTPKTTTTPQTTVTTTITTEIPGTTEEIKNTSPQTTTTPETPVTTTATTKIPDTTEETETTTLKTTTTPQTTVTTTITTKIPGTTEETETTAPQTTTTLETPVTTTATTKIPETTIEPETTTLKTTTSPPTTVTTTSTTEKTSTAEETESTTPKTTTTAETSVTTTTTIEIPGTTEETETTSPQTTTTTETQVTTIATTKIPGTTEETETTTPKTTTTPQTTVTTTTTTEIPGTTEETETTAPLTTTTPETIVTTTATTTKKTSTADKTETTSAQTTTTTETPVTTKIPETTIETETTTPKTTTTPQTTVTTTTTTEKTSTAERTETTAPLTTTTPETPTLPVRSTQHTTLSTGVCRDPLRNQSWPSGAEWKEDCFYKTCRDNTIEMRPVVCPSVVPPVCREDLMRVVKDDQGCCEIWQCDCQCELYGDPHYISFSGNTFDFLDNCTYTLVKEKISRHHLSISVDNYFSSPWLFGSSAKGIILKYRDATVTLQLNAENYTVEATLNDVPVQPPYEEHGIRFEGTHFKVFIYIDEIRSHVSFDPDNTLQITLAMEHFRDNTVGQCGVCGGPSCVRRDGHVESEDCCAMTAYDWIENDPLKPYCIDAPKDVPCVPINPPTPPPSKPPCVAPLCELLKHEMFRECTRSMDVETLVMNCRLDYCAVGKNMICSALQHLSEQCKRLGYCVYWRNLTEGACNVACPEGMIFDECRSTPDDVCQGGSRVPGKFSTDNMRSGCFCPDNKSLAEEHKTFCVSECTHCKGPLGEPMPVGAVWESNCHTCTCNNQTRTEECSPMPPAPSPVCSADTMLVSGCCNNQICVERTCKYNGQNYKVGDMWKDSSKPCVSFTCTTAGTQIEKRVCPEQSCSEELRVWDEHHCCYSCNVTCAVRLSKMTIKVEGCMQEVELPSCEGHCPSTSMTVRSGEVLQLEQERRCCREKDYEIRRLALSCTGAAPSHYTYSHITSCECQPDA